MCEFCSSGSSAARAGTAAAVPTVLSARQTASCAAREGALASAAMNFAEIDKAPEDALNRVLWRAMRGSEPYPEWATSAAVEDDDDEREPFHGRRRRGP